MSRRGALPLLFAALLLAGCSQEGRLIQTPLPVRGVALEYDFIRRTSPSDTSQIDTTVMNVPFKILAHAANPCEAQHAVLELRLLGTALYQMSPVARYNADDKCVQETPTARDTPLVLTVNTLVLVDAPGSHPVAAFEVVNTGGPPFSFDVDSTITSPVSGTVGFEVYVQDAATAAAVMGATVALDTLTSAGVPVPMGSGTTGAQGLYSLAVPCAGAVDTIGPRYRVTVNPGPNQLVFAVPSSPPRCNRRERIYLRI